MTTRFLNTAAVILTTGETYSGNWNDYIACALGDNAGEYNIPAIIEEFTTRINDILPTGYQVVGEHIIADTAAEPITEEGWEEIHAMVDQIDFWKIALKHETIAH